ncbi:MAG: AbgT family transporter [Prevotella sp.]|nr:AbgT family transporter [Prevotella sp.]
MKTNRWSDVLVMAVIVVTMSQLLLFLVSWLIVAASPETTMRSLLSSEGFRWFFGSFVYNVTTPPLVWIIVSAMAYGTINHSSILKIWRKGRGEWTYRQTFAFRIVLVQLLAFALFITLVAFIPHAPLLSATGSLQHSSFLHSIIPVTAAAMVIAAGTFGMLTATMRTFADVVKAMVKGVERAAILIVLYIFAAELFFSVAYVFRLEI